MIRISYCRASPPGPPPSPPAWWKLSLKVWHLCFSPPLSYLLSPQVSPPSPHRTLQMKSIQSCSVEALYAFDSWCLYLEITMHKVWFFWVSKNEAIISQIKSIFQVWRHSVTKHAKLKRWNDYTNGKCLNIAGILAPITKASKQKNKITILGKNYEECQKVSIIVEKVILLPK